VLNYFFRGALEISAPDDYLYAIIDAGFGPNQIPPLSQQFTKIKAKVRNVSEYQNVPESIKGDGALWAIAKYKIQENFDPYLRNTLPWEGYNANATYSYSISEKKAVSADEMNKDTDEDVSEFEFDFSDSPIPINISDLYLQVVFEGKLGEEENAIAVGMKDLYEPTHFTLFNSMDQIFVCREGDATIDECPGFKTVDNMTAACPDRCINCQDDEPVFCSPRWGEGDDIHKTFLEVCPYPTLMTTSVYFSPEGTPLSEPHVEYVDQPAGRHARVIILADNETGGESLRVTGYQTVKWPTESCYLYNFETTQVHPYSMELLLNACHTTMGEDGILYEECATSLVEHRGVRGHSAGGMDSTYGSYILAHWVPSEYYYIPTLEQLGEVVWPKLVDVKPWPADPPEPEN